ncbi:hypothetical protein NHX12_032576 [Muraenolepis orangiensis]|uniref:Uncharacterized protein n=1 Tax=Muraenolepis orangiensis TaxID=630683 RepID=A0A9Q0E9P2_9TELE|nr:hypothetical protein NHX12_032576 [Muraenolepis orangiensis]
MDQSEAVFRIKDQSEAVFRIMDQSEAVFRIKDQSEAVFRIMDQSEAVFRIMDQSEAVFRIMVLVLASGLFSIEADEGESLVEILFRTINSLSLLGGGVHSSPCSLLPVGTLHL